MAHTTDAFEVDGFVQQQKELEAWLMSNPEMEKKVQKLIRQVLMSARRELMGDAKQAIKDDPRQAYKAVKTSVYRQILGGNVSILQKKRASGGGSYTPQRTLQPHQRGGNRRPRSERTKKIDSYMGSDRGFILRFLEAGVNGRHISFVGDPHRGKVKRGSQGGNLKKYGKTTNTGLRGNIGARHFFSTNSQKALEKAADELTKLIDDLIKQNKI